MPRKRPGSPSTHITLLARLAAGKDAEAWKIFVDLYTPLVYNFCRWRGLQDADARDVTQQVLTSVHRFIEKFAYDPARGKFRDWLGVVTLHEIRRHQRRQRRGRGQGGAVLSAADLATSTADPDWIDEFNDYMFRTAIERIRPEVESEVWQAFEWTWLGSLPPREAAARLGRPVGWVYKARYRVVQRLRKELEFLTSDAALLQKPS
jgi:RNA polymerase sigma-70 factor (ECF subfamily)